jgi:hypothetical protein
VCADGFADGVVGVVGLTVSYQNRVVRLPEVVVFKTLQVPFLLGMDWIDAAKVAVMTEDHKGVVYLRDSKGDVIREQAWPTLQLIPAPKDKPARTELPREVFKSDTIIDIEEAVLTDTESSGLFQNHESLCTIPEEPEIPSQLRSSKRVLAPVTLEVEVEMHPEPKTSTQPLESALSAGHLPEQVPAKEKTKSELPKMEWQARRHVFHWRSDPLYTPEDVVNNEIDWRFKEGVDELRAIGAIIADYGEPHEKPPTREKLHPLKGQRIPKWSKGVLQFRTPGRKDGTWMISPANGIEGGKGWASPACLVTAVNGLVEIPFINADDRPCSWIDVRGRLVAEEFNEETELVADEREARVIATIEQLEPEWHNSPIDSFDHMMDEGLTPEQVEEVKAILERHKGLFSKTKGLTHLVEHKIETGDAKPVWTKPSRVSPHERRLIRDLVQTMMDDDVVEPSNSAWSSRVVLAPKPNGRGIRFCVDFRAVNKLCTRDVHPLPVMDDLLGQLDGATYYSSMDLEAGFWQIPVAPGDRPKCAFVTPDGLYQFKRLPFGLQASPPNFQRLMNQVLKGLLWTECLCYLDDILVYGRTWKEHLARLDRVLMALLKAGLTLNHKKCCFGARRVKFLGHMVDARGISPNPEKVEAVANFPRPDTVTKLRAFLGLASFFRKFIRGFSEIVRPLNELLKKGANIVRDWSKVHDEAMDLIKEKLSTAPVLTHDDGLSQLELQTDASAKGLGAVLYLLKDDVRKPIAYASRRLKDAEERYHANELEFLALIWALKRFKHHLYGRPCLVKTDIRW